MTIYDIQRIIKVTSFDNECIVYKYNEDIHSLTFTPESLAPELINICSIDLPDELDNYHISQWDALNLVIRHELRREEERALENTALFKAIANIIKP